MAPVPKVAESSHSIQKNRKLIEFADTSLIVGPIDPSSITNYQVHFDFPFRPWVAVAVFAVTPSLLTIL
jgi:hypothetical protein